MHITQAREIFNVLSITQVCDVAKNVRVLDGALRPFTQQPKMLGKAFTVNAEGDLLPVIKSLQLATNENIIMINSGKSSSAIAGELFASEAKRKNIAGIVIDGFCRDAQAVNQIGVPFYARGICPKAGTKNKLGEFNIPIQCGGVTIFPDDIILGDENGVIAIAMEELPEIFSLAVEIKNNEDSALDKINKGTSIVELFNFVEHYNKLTIGEESAFHWK
jgi:4-hydroxy-4-methyl-2-oxoglutarate aldolase